MDWISFKVWISNTAGYFESLGIPGFLAYVVATIELVGGIAIVLGAGTKIVATLFLLIMAGAILTAKLPLGFLGNGQMAGFELDLALLAMSLFFIFADKSSLSLDHKLFSTKKN